MRPTIHPHPKHKREGRVLAECIVSLALLAIAVSASLTLSRASLMLADEARMMTELAATTTAQAEQTAADACTNTSASGQLTNTRLIVTWSDVISPSAPQSIRQRQLTATAHFTPLAERDSTTLTITAGGTCPW